MAKKIHFQDDLYQLSREIDCISESLLIDIDADFFGKHIIESTVFFHHTIRQLYTILESNGQFIERNEQLRNLYTVQRKFIALLSALETTQGHLQQTYLTNRITVTEIKDAQLLIQKPISDILQIDITADDSQDIVSGEELSQLLKF